MDIESQIAAARSAIAGTDGVIRGRRKPRLGKPGGRGSLFFSAKNAGQIAVRNRLQRHYCYVIEADPDISMYRTDAVEFETSFCALWPTFVVWDLRGRASLREVVALRGPTVPKVEARLRAMTLAARSAGLTLDVITKRDIQELGNPEVLEAVYDRGGRRYRAEEVREPVLRLFKALSHGSPTIGMLRLSLAEHALPSGYLEAAIFHRILAIRDGQTFGPDAQIDISQPGIVFSESTHSAIPELIVGSRDRCPDELTADGEGLSAVGEGVLAAQRPGHRSGGSDE